MNAIRRSGNEHGRGHQAGHCRVVDLSSKHSELAAAQKVGLWKLENLERFSGGRIKFDQEVRLYNIRFKLYLSLTKQTIKKTCTSLQPARRLTTVRCFVWNLYKQDPSTSQVGVADVHASGHWDSPWHQLRSQNLRWEDKWLSNETVQIRVNVDNNRIGTTWRGYQEIAASCSQTRQRKTLIAISYSFIGGLFLAAKYSVVPGEWEFKGWQCDTSQEQSFEEN